jgi:hypothetical protein
MNNTHSDDSDSVVVVVTTLTGAFMVFFMCFMLRMCFETRYLHNLMVTSQTPPAYVSESPPTYESSPSSYPPPPLYEELNSCTQTLTQEPRPQEPP